MPNRISVSSADFIRNIGYWQSEALKHPISITHHGRERLILAAVEQFQHSASANEAELEKALSLSRSLNSTILDQVEEGYVRFDEHLRIISVNRVVDETLGRPREQLIDAALVDTFPSIASSVWQNHLQRVLRSRKAENFESRFDHIHIRARAFPLLEGVGVIFHNITEEVRLRDACENSDAQIAAMANIAELSSVHMNHQGRIEFADDAFCQLTSFTSADLTGHKLTDLVSIENRRPLSEALERVLGGAERTKLLIGIRDKSGGEHATTFSLAPIMSDLIVRGAYAMVLAQR